MSGVEHYCPKAGPIFISALLLQRSRVEHYCPKAGPIFISAWFLCNNQADINIGPALGQ
jgi:predicted RNA-binding Zn-ribbon protein involved in translation (DUF1610 family)